MKRIIGISASVLAIVMFIAVGCESNEVNTGTNGTLKINVTDGPFAIDMIEEANVVITKVEIRKSSEDEGSPFITLMEDTMAFNLLELRNGVMANLLELKIPEGEYNLIRLYVEEASIKVKDGDFYEVKVPSGSQTGIKIFIDPSVAVSGGLTSELLLDFCLDKSFVLKGNMDTPAGIKGFNFKPVIRAVNNSYAGRIEGTVSDTAGVEIANAAVWLEKDTVISTSYSDSLGYYSLIGIPEGIYDLYAAKENFDTLLVEDVAIMKANLTRKDLVLQPNP